MKKSKWLLLVALPAAIVMLLATLVPGAEATGGYASQTGQSCGTCHINPGGGGARTATGQAFKDGGYVWPIATTTTAAPTTTTTVPSTTTTTAASTTTSTTTGASKIATTSVVAVTEPDDDDEVTEPDDDDEVTEPDDDDDTETVSESDDDDSEDDGIEPVYESERERGHQHDRENHGHKDGKKSGSALKQETGSFEHGLSKLFHEERFVRDDD